MAGRRKNLSNPASTGGIGPLFEARVQATFVGLMLTGGYSPLLRPWPINKIKLQGKVAGFDTDDLIVFVEDKESCEQRKLLAQIKHSISISKKDSTFAEVIQAAWDDFHGGIFHQDKDAIALITGPLSHKDFHNTTWVLDQAKTTENCDEFLERLEKAKFSPPYCVEKYEAFKHQILNANGGKTVSDEDVYNFLSTYHLLGYDLGGQLGVVQSLLHSHIGQLSDQLPDLVWSKLVEFVQDWNKSAGTIVLEKVPKDIVELFRKKITHMPRGLYVEPEEQRKTNLSNYPNPDVLAILSLIGGWNE